MKEGLQQENHGNNRPGYKSAQKHLADSPKKTKTGLKRSAASGELSKRRNEAKSAILSAKPRTRRGVGKRSTRLKGGQTAKTVSLTTSKMSPEERTKKKNAKPAASLTVT